MKKYLYWLLPIGWMGVIFYSSAQPYEKQDMKPLLSNTINLSFLEPFVKGISFTYHRSVVSIETLGIEGFVEFFIRKGAHFTVFFILMCFFYKAFAKSTTLSMHTILLISFLFTLIYAAFDEFHQGFTVNRTPYIGDVILDGFGAFVAYLLLMVIGKRRKPANNLSKSPGKTL